MSPLTEDKKANLHSNMEKYMEFSLGPEFYALPLLNVKEVIAPTTYTSIPGCPPYMLGLINLRGQVLSVFDLRKKLNIKVADEPKEQAIIIVDFDPTFIGLRVDSINTVVALASKDIKPFPEDIGNKANYMEGVYNSASKLVVLVDIAKMLGADVSFLQKRVA